MANPTTTVKATTITGNIIIDSVLSYASWSSAITFSFPTVGSYWEEIDEEVSTLTPFTATEQQQAREIFTLWSNIANIQLSEGVENGLTKGDIRLAHSDLVGADDIYKAYTVLPQSLFELDEGVQPSSGNVWFNTNDYANQRGALSYHIIMHEIGHALGLRHTHDGQVITPKALDNAKYSIMSYNHHEDTFNDDGENYPITPMLFDVAAIQYLYGANTSYHAGNDVYQFSTTGEILTVWDGGGIDVFDFSNQDKGVTISLVEGEYNSVGSIDNGFSDANDNMVIAYNAVIENVIGSRFSDNLTGNDATNTLTGGRGNDTLNGGNGGDIAYFNVNYHDAQITFNSNGSVKVKSSEGKDTLNSVESLQFLDGFVDIADRTLEARAVNNDNAAQVISLYQAALNREPDNGGMNFWIDAYSNGVDLLTISQDFLNSEEFNSLFDTSTNEAYVDTLYQNVLGREGEAGGVEFWNNGLDNGVSKAAVLIDFSESNENQTNIEPLLSGLNYQASDGLWGI